MSIQLLNERAREILRLIVENYVDTGEPIGSRTISRRLNMSLSPASIRNVMADLEELGLLFAPHTSAGRLPTHAGLRLFVDGLLELGNLSPEERESISGQCAAAGRSVEEVFGEATTILSGLSRCAGLVIAPKIDAPLKHIEFIGLDQTRGIAVTVTQDGMVENRVIELPPGLPLASLREASNYLNARVAGQTLQEAGELIRREIAEHRTELDALAERVVEAGIAAWSENSSRATLVVRGQHNLLEDIQAGEDLERIRAIFELLETKEGMLRLLELTEGGEGVRIFIGAENTLFSMSDCAAVVATFRNSQQKIIGAVGVIGPTRLNYARVIPMVDYTSKVIGRILG